jgi:hypothetical protein
MATVAISKCQKLNSPPLKKTTILYMKVHNSEAIIFEKMFPYVHPLRISGKLII